jgi:predicted nucleic acid-binding protein
MLAAGRKRISLVDWASFGLMRRLRIDTAFTFDRDFAGQGFELIPPQVPPEPAISR